MNRILKAGIFQFSLLLISCGLFAQSVSWEAQLTRNDGNNIRFTFDWKTVKGKNIWVIRNASEKITVDNITVEGDSLFVQMPVFESQFRVKKTGHKLEGTWIKGGAVKTTILPFMAVPGINRFEAKNKAVKNISGRWAVNFSASKASELSVAEFKQTGNKLTGTFLNATGDYRYLQGIVTGDSLLLSGFDGGHAFLFTAKIETNKKITAGKFYSGAVYNEDWKAVKDATVKVPLESVAMYVKPGEESLHFTFKDLNGKPVSITDDRFKNKIVVIQLMGSWCPNCMDETAFLSEYYNNNKQRGIEVIALAYEYSTNWERSTRSLKKFKDRYDVQYTILNTEVTVTDSLRTEKTLPELTPIKFFPSSVILDKKGKVRKLDTGFNGPATGVHYIAYKKEFEETIDELLKEH
ncbi:MAG: TlpA family protein disulfide reductase [Chitinophagaceae bacterium]|nr:TlpA family protein disulfide reductase [Chitinophagaceae bacterium]